MRWGLLIMSGIRIVLSAVIFVFMTALTQHASAQDTFTTRLAQLGFAKEECIDWSDSADISLPMPTCAYANLSGIYTLPTLSTDAYKAWIEVYDGNGNYFKKRVILGAQGHRAMQYPKKNFKADFCNDEWVGEDTPDIKFGKWVKQDGFHLKAFYFDFLRGISTVGYHIYDQITQDRGERGRIWERADNIGKPNKNALCHPDAFPCILYLNNEFYGIYNWQLKKHRKNMNQTKDVAEHVHLDGKIVDKGTFFGGTIDWNNIEIRNPKNLYTMTGKLYDGDSPDELIDESSKYFNLSYDTEAEKADKARTAKVKKYVLAFSKYCNELQTLVKNKEDNATIRAAIEERFDVTSIIDYIIHNMVTHNLDGLRKNYQWFTYDGKKWFVAPYDLDNTFGYSVSVDFHIFESQYYYTSPISLWNFSNYPPLSWVEKYYKEDINRRYAYLRDQGLLNAESINSMITNWYYSIGEANYNDEWKEWNTSPCLLETIANSPWQIQTYNYNKYKAASEYNDAVTYEAGQYCRYLLRLMKATSTVKGVKPLKQVGCKDSLARIKAWTIGRIKSVDTWMNYSFTSAPTSYTLTITSAEWTTLCVPFGFAIPDDIEVFTVKGQHSDGQLITERVHETQAYKPYLVKGASGDYVLTGITEQPDETADDYLVNGCLTGCLKEKYAPKDSYVLQNHNGNTGFYRVVENGKVKLGANRAFLTLDTDAASGFIILDDNQDITSVSITEMPSYISGIYDVNGTLHQTISTGVNIIKYDNGKTIKVVVR